MMCFTVLHNITTIVQKNKSFCPVRYLLLLSLLKLLCHYQMFSQTSLWWQCCCFRWLSVSFNQCDKIPSRVGRLTVSTGTAELCSSLPRWQNEQQGSALWFPYQHKHPIMFRFFISSSWIHITTEMHHCAGL